MRMGHEKQEQDSGLVSLAAIPVAVAVAIVVAVAPAHALIIAGLLRSEFPQWRPDHNCPAWTPWLPEAKDL